MAFDEGCAEIPDSGAQSQGTMAEYLTLPTGNLHTVPEEVTDQDACFAEPLAAACRIAEQQVCSRALS